MRALAILFAVFAAGFLLGHEFWPEPNEDPQYHLRFHRGRMPYIAVDNAAPTNSIHHGRVAQPPR